jgi:hypothetical protein
LPRSQLGINVSLCVRDPLFECADFIGHVNVTLERLLVETVQFFGEVTKRLLEIEHVRGLFHDSEKLPAGGKRCQ